MKKKIIIGIIVALVIAFVVGSIVYINMSGDSIDLSIADEITLNDNEKEVLEVLKQVDNYLKNPPQKEEDTNTIDFTISLTEPTDFKTVFSKVYEVRKHTSEEGKVSYMLDVDMNSETEEVDTRRYITIDDDGITVYLKKNDLNTLDIEEEGKYENGTYTFGKEFYEAIFEEVEENVNKAWQESATYTNVDYDKIYSKI